MARFSIFTFTLCFVLLSCGDSKNKKASNEFATGDSFYYVNDTLVELTELQPCDILVKPNHNWIYGTSLVTGGSGFGHAMLVIKGAEGENALDVLQKAEVFESIAKGLPDQYQLRKSPAFFYSDDSKLSNTTFGEQNAGFRYRLRLPLTPAQKDSIISFVLRQDSDISNWRSQKVFQSENAKKIWYCSLLVWEAFHSVLGIDIDSNGGLMIYPNDLITSKYFDSSDSETYKKRVRF